MLSEQKIRGVLFYLSVLVFFAGLPFILSFALGYKFDPRTMKFTQTGLISIRTQPQGASIYLDSRLFKDRAPATVQELLPGPYNIRVELDGHYPWAAQVNVQPRKVARFEKIILFPLRPNIKQVNHKSASSFRLDKNKVYYFNEKERMLYSSGLEGEKVEKISRIPETFKSALRGIKISSDKEKAALYNKNQVCVVYLSREAKILYGHDAFVLNYPEWEIADVFWHSDSYHLVLVTDRKIAVTEASLKSTPVTLVNLNKQASEKFYDEDKDSFYFSDSQRGPDGLIYENVYKLELNSRQSIFDNIIKPSQNEKQDVHKEDS